MTRLLQNLALLTRSGARVMVRIPIVPGVNDDAENLEQTAAYLAGLTKVEEIAILPYHDRAKGKYNRLNLACWSPETRAPGAQRLQDIADGLARRGLRVSIGG